MAQEEGGEGFLLNLDTGRYYSLNRTGMLVWRALEDGADPVEAICSRFPTAPTADVARDVDAVLADLSSAHLVASRPEGDGASVR